MKIVKYNYFCRLLLTSFVLYFFKLFDTFSLLQNNEKIDFFYLSILLNTNIYLNYNVISKVNYIYFIIFSFFLCFYSYSNIFYINKIYYFLELFFCSIVIAYLINIIEDKGIENGISLFIFFNVLKNITKSDKNNILCSIFLFFLIYFLQIAKLDLKILSPTQIYFYTTNDLKKNVYSIPLNIIGYIPTYIIFNAYTSDNTHFKSFIYVLFVALLIHIHFKILFNINKIYNQFLKNSIHMINIESKKHVLKYFNYIINYMTVIDNFIIYFLFLLVNYLEKHNLLSKSNILYFIINGIILYENRKIIKYII